MAQQLQSLEALKRDLLLTLVHVMKANRPVVLQRGDSVPLQWQPMFFQIQVNPRSTRAG